MHRHRQARSCAEASKRGIWRPSGGALNWLACRNVWMRVVTARVSGSFTCSAAWTAAGYSGHTERCCSVSLT